MDGWMNVWMDFNFFIWSPYFGGMLKYFLLKKKFGPYIWRNFGCSFHFGLHIMHRQKIPKCIYFPGYNVFINIEGKLCPRCKIYPTCKQPLRI